MKKSQQSRNILSELDLEILKAISKRDYAILELRKDLKINPLSARRHLIRLQQLKLIKRERVDKTNKAHLTITQYGKDLLKLFNKILATN